MVRAKFTCHKNDNGAVALYAVADVDGTNKTWAKATPSGQLLMQIDNPPAAEQFKVGQDYFIDFTPVTDGPTPPTDG
jgi:hypothetical protein